MNQLKPTVVISKRNCCFEATLISLMIEFQNDGGIDCIVQSITQVCFLFFGEYPLHKFVMSR